jgi:hypothetical protein
MQCAHEPLYEIDPQTGVSFEVFYADRTLETFGLGGAGWFWWPRRRGCSPDGSPTGPFATSYAAYRHALTTLTPPGRGAATQTEPSWNLFGTSRAITRASLKDTTQK